MKATMPKWATSERLELLSNIGTDHTCAMGEESCPVIRELSNAIAKRLGPAHAANDKLLWAQSAGILIAKLVKAKVRVKGPRGKMVTENVYPLWKQSHLPQFYRGELIEWWKQQDRDEAAMLRAEAKRAFTAPDMTGWGQVLDAMRPGDHFDPVDRELFFAQQPEFYAGREGVGWDVKNQKPVRIVEVRVASSSTSLMVEVALSKPSLNRRQRRQRAAKRGRWIQHPEVFAQCEAAVQDYKAR